MTHNIPAFEGLEPRLMLDGVPGNQTIELFKGVGTLVPALATAGITNLF